MILNNARYVLALDPSGSYKEGKGHTGWCLLDQETNKIVKFGVIAANSYSCQFQYWDAHITLIDSLAGYHPDVVIEDYLLYGERAKNQINSRLETPQLIGIIKYETYKRGLYIHIQTAMQVKTRWTDDVLAHKGYFLKKGKSYYMNNINLVSHIKDSVRHAVHYMTYNSKYKGGEVNNGNKKHTIEVKQQKNGDYKVISDLEQLPIDVVEYAVNETAKIIKEELKENVEGIVDGAEAMTEIFEGVVRQNKILWASTIISLVGLFIAVAKMKGWL